MVTEEHSDLIFDVGLLDGSDTAYFLFRGYNVVAIDANPLMIENAKLRFAREIEAGRLTLLNVGISEAAGHATFWISETPEWSSFDRAVASRDGASLQPITVAAVPFSQLLAEYGVPYYLKVDIEGNDGLCVDALRETGKLPLYLSVEAECVGDSALISDDQAVAMLKLLNDVGYRRFKLVKQGKAWRAVRSNAGINLYMEVVTSAARGRLRKVGLSRFAEKLTDSARIAPLGFDFPDMSSGPWGEDIPGGWMNFEKARSTYLRERSRCFAWNRNIWHDWHATY